MREPHLGLRAQKVKGVVSVMAWKRQTLSPEAPPNARWLGLRDSPAPFPTDTPNYLGITSVVYIFGRTGKAGG